jgi:hypothetical protein
MIKNQVTWLLLDFFCYTFVAATVQSFRILLGTMIKGESGVNPEQFPLL